MLPVRLCGPGPRLVLKNPMIYRLCQRNSFPSRRGTHNTAITTDSILTPLNTFPRRHVGPSDDEAASMLRSLAPPTQTLDELVSQTIPPDIRLSKPLSMSQASDVAKESGGMAEHDVVNLISSLLDKNDVLKSYIGAGYYGTLVPQVIRRNLLENPAWYTSYTPYQAEISQGRLESLLNFQTMVSDLTSLPIANASVLDEATAAADAMTLSINALPAARQKRQSKTFVVSHLCHPQTIAVLQSRSPGFGIRVKVCDIFANDHQHVREEGQDLIGVLAQYPDTEGGVLPLDSLANVSHSLGVILSVATDLMALTLLKSPGEFGADIAIGSAQRFGVPLGYGGPHAAFFACSNKFRRKIPGRLVGLSKDRLGNKALRLALQTREQHIRREKATSNICTAQALLANMSAMYAVYHGPHGLRAIAQKIRSTTRLVQKHMEHNGWKIITRGRREDGAVLFDTIVAEGSKEQVAVALGKRSSTQSRHANLRVFGPNKIGISLDETVVTHQQIMDLCAQFGPVYAIESDFDQCRRWISETVDTQSGLSVFNDSLPPDLLRESFYLQHPVFNRYHSETELLRYIYHLQSKDLSLVHSMIPLGSCTMKLNGTVEMLALSKSQASDIHPFAPLVEAEGYQQLIKSLSAQLCAITGMDDISLQPNSGAQGEFAGLRVIKKHLDVRENGNKRNICLIPVSAHGTNPASAVMAGMKVVPLKCDTSTGNLDVKDLTSKCQQYKDELAAIMVTYPSTFGVFEPQIKKVCSIVHEHGGQVYMDGANINAQIGLCNPGEIGADVCHLNLHKTFCIPHGGGGPGVGPIAVKSHLAPYLPSHPFYDPHTSLKQTNASTSAPNGVLVPGYSDEASLLSRDGSPEAHKGDPARALAISPVSAAPWGSASLLPISYAYNTLMGSRGLTQATKVTLLNANYLMSRLKEHYSILYTNPQERCAHEFILDMRGFKDSAGIEAIDVAKRLQDYSFHAPTMSWPVAGTLMIEPTESESRAELDRFCEALISIRKEIQAIEKGEKPREGNLLKMAPHSQQDLLGSNWDRCYTRQEAAYPVPGLREKKFWPSVCRVDDGKYRSR